MNLTKKFQIPSIDTQLEKQIQAVIDQKTKPLGALGILETIAKRVCLIQQSLSPQLSAPQVIVFAADHGATAQRISQYPSAVTRQMVLNFLNGGAAINVFSRLNGLALTVVDVGVNSVFSPDEQLARAENCQFIAAKVALGTQNYFQAPAMSADEMAQAMAHGANIVAQKTQATGANVFAFGEMGIGNTASASLLMHLLTQIPLDECVGRGTGLDDAALAQKKQLLAQALAQHADVQTPLAALQTFGGLEIAAMVGAYLQAAAQQTVILVDGFIATAALLVAQRIEPEVLSYCFFAHQSDERGHRLLLAHLQATPLLQLSMRLGEGTGAALAYPLLAAAVAFVNEMASFESAGVSEAG
jgi:nicotinate-nucleotide--dimethylbenzimidazole phosphoribosyltransferase